jgi:hypothetical protein
VEAAAIYGTVGVLIGVGGLLLGAAERRGRKRAELRDIASAARALHAEGRAARADARAELAEARELERAQRDRPEDLPWLRLELFAEEGSRDDQAVFVATVTNFGTCEAVAARLEVWKADEPDVRTTSDSQAIGSQVRARLSVRVPWEWTVEGGRELAPGVQARVVDAVTHAEVSIVP